jgi:hypothetical protein
MMKKQNINKQMVNELLKDTISLRTALHRIREITGEELVYDNNAAARNLWTWATGHWENAAENIKVWTHQGDLHIDTLYDDDTHITTHAQLNEALAAQQIVKQQLFGAEYKHKHEELITRINDIISNYHCMGASNHYWRTTYDGYGKNSHHYNPSYTWREHTYTTPWDNCDEEYYYEDAYIQIELAYNDYTDQYMLTITVSTATGLHTYDAALTQLTDIDTLFAQASYHIDQATQAYADYICECLAEEELQEEELLKQQQDLAQREAA